jgi:hypothetical protein
MPEILIQDPYHEYGTLFLDHIYRQYGYPAVVFYTNPAERRALEPRHPLPSQCIAAAYDVKSGDMERFADYLGKRHRVAAVIPFNETSLLNASLLSARLGLGWGPPAVIRRFRDKFSFKEHLRAAAPAIRVNASRVVGSIAEVLRARREAPYGRFILKPNDGFGNRDIGYFDSSATGQAIGQYLHRMRQRTIVMEEYVAGTEYFVNGQIDDVGNIHTIAIFEYVRRPANGRHNMDVETTRVPHGTASFQVIARYAEDVMRATGLTRSPFHLELKVDDEGPCLIEAAARLGGNGSAVVSGELHGPHLDMIALASQYYLNTGDRRAPALDWSAYDKIVVRYVHGIAARRECIYHTQGIAEVEALPEFCRWVKKPEIGGQVERTVDCLSMPWSLILKTTSENRAEAAAREVRRLIRWNCPDAGVFSRRAMMLKVRILRGLSRIRRTLRGRLLRRFTAETSMWADAQHKR